MIMNAPNSWPVTAASKIRVVSTKDVDADEQKYCRLFFNESNYKIELVSTDDAIHHELNVYDDVNTGIENE